MNLRNRVLTAGVALAVLTGAAATRAYMQVVPSMDILKSYTAASAALISPVHLVDYYASTHTNGGGDFVWRASVSGTPDDGVLVAPSDHPGTCAFGCWVRELNGSVPTSPMYGTYGDGVQNDQAAVKRLVEGNCGKPVELHGALKFSAVISIVANCSPKATGVEGASINSASIAGSNPVFTATGTAGALVNVSTNVVAGATSVTVASAAGFCQPSGSIPSPACALKIQSNAQFSVVTPLHGIGEIKFIKSIAGNVITIFGQFEDGYLTADSAKAQPLTMLDRPYFANIKWVAPGTDNAQRGLSLTRTYEAQLSQLTFNGFGGDGAVEITDSWQTSGDHITCNGLGSTSVISDAYCVIDVDATEFSTWSFIVGNSSGPCYTQGQNSTTYGLTRNAKVGPLTCSFLQGVNGYAVQDHGNGIGLKVFDVEVIYNPSNSGHGDALSFSNINVDVSDVRISNAGGAGLYFKNLTNRNGYARASNVVVATAADSCVIVEQGNTSATGLYSSVTLDGLQLTGCGKYGVLGVTTGTNPISNLTVTSPYINGTGATYHGMYLPRTSGCTISNPRITGLGSAAVSALYLDFLSYCSITGGSITAPASATGRLVYVRAAGAADSHDNMIAGMNIYSPSDVSSTGIYVDNNATYTGIGLNQIHGPTTPYHGSSGTGSFSGAACSGAPTVGFRTTASGQVTAC